MLNHEFLKFLLDIFMPYGYNDSERPKMGTPNRESSPDGQNYNITDKEYFNVFWVWDS